MTFAKNLLARTGLLEPARRIRSAGIRAMRMALHPVRERLTRLPDPWFLMTNAEPLASPYREHLEALRRDGVTRLSGQVPPAALEALRRSFEEFTRRLDAATATRAGDQEDVTESEEYFDAASRQYSSNEPFTFSRALLEVCLRPELTTLIDRYLGKTAYITQGVAYRIEPNPNTGFGSFQWHHDAWGKRINMMIILTEVGEGDQHMTYAKGSHLLRHGYDKYANSRFSQEEFTERCSRMEILNCYASPGDIYIFDSNGIHSGNRTNGRTRDTFIIEYSRLAHTIWAHRIPPAFLQGFSEKQLEPLSWILRQDRNKRALAPAVNSWVGQLLRVDKWLL